VQDSSESVEGDLFET